MSLVSCKRTKTHLPGRLRFIAIEEDGQVVVRGLLSHPLPTGRLRAIAIFTLVAFERMVGRRVLDALKCRKAVEETAKLVALVCRCPAHCRAPGPHRVLCRRLACRSAIVGANAADTGPGLRPNGLPDRRRRPTATATGPGPKPRLSTQFSLLSLFSESSEGTLLHHTHERAFIQFADRLIHDFRLH